jgi:HSP20 family molecular chaperone IbpA
LPRIEEFDEHGHLAITMPPGVTKDTLQVRAGAGTLMVTAGGESHKEHHEEGDPFVSESFSASSGAFSQSFSIPSSVRASQVRALLGSDGVLHIQLPEVQQIARQLTPSRRMRSVRVQQ